MKLCLGDLHLISSWITFVKSETNLIPHYIFIMSNYCNVNGFSLQMQFTSCLCPLVYTCSQGLLSYLAFDSFDIMSTCYYRNASCTQMTYYYYCISQIDNCILWQDISNNIQFLHLNQQIFNLVIKTSHKINNCCNASHVTTSKTTSCRPFTSLLNTCSCYLYLWDFINPLVFV